VGLPQLDFRVPEATWFKSVLAGKFGVMPGLSATGTLAWPYKIAVVAVMMLVAGGTLVTFGSAGAETPESSEVSALPGSDEASPTVEGQVLPPPATGLLNSADLMSSLNLTDFSPGEGATLSLSDDDDESDEDNDDGDEDNKSTAKKKSPSTKSTPKPSETKAPSDDPTDEPTDDPTNEPTDEPTDEPDDEDEEDEEDEEEDCHWEGSTLLTKKWVCS
jgi:hypothetical protein